MFSGAVYNNTSADSNYESTCTVQSGSATVTASLAYKAELHTDNINWNRWLEIKSDTPDGGFMKDLQNQMLASSGRVNEDSLSLIITCSVRHTKLIIFLSMILG